MKQIEYFVQVAELGSFTRASNFLAIAQPALSRQVRTLEVELRQALFVRNGRGVTLTEAGQRLLAHGRGILKQVARARLDLETQRGAATGRITIGMPPSVSRTLTAPLVGTFRERLPKATLSVVEGLTTYVMEWLSTGRVDCAVVYNVAPSPAVELLPVIEEQLYLASNRKSVRGNRLIGAPLTLAEVAERELVMPSRPHSIRMLLESALASEGRKAKVGLEIESMPAIFDLVQREHLHAVVTLNAIKSRKRERDFHLRPIGKPGLKAKLWIATSAQRHRGPLIDQSVELVRELMLKLWQ